MDSGKKEALTKVSWKPVKSCGTCFYGRFQRGESWGVCSNTSNDYHHNKHVSKRELPANKMASCDKWLVDGDGPYMDLLDFLNGPITS